MNGDICMHSPVTRQSVEPRSRWLLLIHQIPPEPAYQRVKVSRRLARVGAVQLKSTVYVLPWTDTCHEDFQWIRRELIDGGGEATIFAASLVEGLADADIEAMFRAQRDEDYATLDNELAELAKGVGHAPLDKARRAQADNEFARMKRRLLEIQRTDFFEAERGPRVQARLEALQEKLVQSEPSQVTLPEPLDRKRYQQRVWVTRAGIKVDRIASAWLIRRFIDADARFRFVDIASYKHRGKELRFDMADGEFTHREDLCTFEVLCRCFQLEHLGLHVLAEIVHDLDVKDGRYRRTDNEGVATLVQGLVAAHAKDDARLAAGMVVFDTLYAAMSSQGPR